MEEGEEGGGEGEGRGEWDEREEEDRTTSIFSSLIDCEGRKTSDDRVSIKMRKAGGEGGGEGKGREEGGGGEGYWLVYSVTHTVSLVAIVKGYTGEGRTLPLPSSLSCSVYFLYASSLQIYILRFFSQ